PHRRGADRLRRRRRRTAPRSGARRGARPSCRRRRAPLARLGSCGPRLRRHLRRYRGATVAAPRAPRRAAGAPREATSLIVHVPPSSRMGGIASLVLPALRELGAPIKAAFLVEERCGAPGRRGFESAVAQGLDAVEIKVRSRLDLAAVRRLAELLRSERPWI